MYMMDTHTVPEDFLTQYINSFASKDEGVKQEPAEPQKSMTFAEKMRAKREAASELAKEGFADVWGSDEKYRQLLDIYARFDMSPGTGSGATNGALIYMQRPDATVLASFGDWKSLGTSIRKGAAAIHLFTPVVKPDKQTGEARTYYNVEDFYDVAQTRVNVTDTPMIETDPLEVVRAVANAQHFSIEFDDGIPDGVNAVYIPQINEVRVRDGQDAPTMARSLLQETAHYQMAKMQGYRRSAETDFAASSSAYIISKRLGLDCSGFSFGKEVFPAEITTPAQIKETMAAVCQLSKAVSSLLEKQLPQLQKESSEVDKDTQL